MLRVIGLASVLGVAACGASSVPPPFTPVADVKQLMTEVLDPAADVLWDAVGVTVTAGGTEEKAPQTDEDWAAVRRSAFIVAESGNLLMMGSRAMDQGEWMRLSQALVEVGTRAIQAADAKDKDAVFNVGGDVYAVCTNCHQKYIPAIAEQP